MIRAVRARALAIPISPVSYGFTPAEFPGLFLLRTKMGAYLVQHGEQVRGTKVQPGRARMMGGFAAKRRSAGLNFLFKLVGAVEQKADPSVMPSETEMVTTAKTAMGSFLQRRLAR